jgi:hypothetical protein
MDMVMYFLIKGGTIRCFHMVAKYAPVAFSEINTALAEKHQAPAPPTSCAALLAQEMGVSDMRAVMAAGLAGGIGLCGGACGALGTAIWITGTNSLEKKDGTIDFNDPRVLGVIEKFLECTDYRFECSKIVGHKFENVGDHADYLRDGGCSEIIQVLAAT